MRYNATASNVKHDLESQLLETAVAIYPLDMPSALLITQVFRATKSLPRAPLISLDLTASPLGKTTIHRDVYLALATTGVPLTKVALDLASLCGLEDFKGSEYEDDLLVCCNSLTELNVDFTADVKEGVEPMHFLADIALACRTIDAVEILQALKIRMSLVEGMIGLEHSRQFVRCLLFAEPGPGLQIIELSAISLKIKTLIEVFKRGSSTITSLMLVDIDLISPEGVRWTTVLESMSVLPRLNSLRVVRLCDTDARISKGWMFAGTEVRKEWTSQAQLGQGMQALLEENTEAMESD
ncbi:hypothetical protein B0A48_01724 [Cryoendolithus antarcticus]|uniref:Uncharacterized protein n=1 Tax=Cryoendolithus antarcticus TaxID=1507870 RepID=A0A1V8TQ33_9PEZI|nr:hypothetical protein B0A48_01724 [Cryoendolithus antarcticus]